MTDFERQNAVHRELRDGDFSSRTARTNVNDGEMFRLAKIFGLTVFVVFGLVGTLAVLSV